MAVDSRMVEVTERFGSGFTWRRSGPGLLECRSHALRDADGRTWLVDPFDGAGLDEELEALGGDVGGVVVLLDRHLRDAVALGRRYRVDLHVPPGRWRRGHPAPARSLPLEPAIEGCSFEFTRLVQRQGQWLEWAMWSPHDRVLVVPEAVGSASWYRSRWREPLAVHPLLRVIDPPHALAELARERPIDRLLVGHGPSLGSGAQVDVELAVGEARRELPWLAAAAPRHAVRWARAAIGGSRASC